MRFLSILFILATLSLGAEQIQHDPFIIHVTPKCGTHYILNIVHMLTKQAITNHNISNKSLADAEKRNKIIRTFQPYNSKVSKLLKDHKYKVVSMIRDPRDALISLLIHMRNFKGLGVKRDFFAVPPDFDDLSVEDQITVLISGRPGFQSYLDFYKSRIEWSNHKHVVTVRYEDLVGSAGEGDDARKRATLRKMVNFLNIKISDSYFNLVLNNMYSRWGDTEVDGQVVRRGRIGGWKDFFTDKHKQLFKQKFGKTLIKLGYETSNQW